MARRKRCDVVDLLIPIARRIPVVYNAAGIPLALRGQVSGAVRNAAEAGEIAYAFGRDAKPVQPILVYGPDERVVTVIMGNGLTEAAELQDIALEAMEVNRERQRRQGGTVNFDELREEAGLVPRDQYDAAFRDALRRRVAQHKANPITDPARQVRWQ